MLGARPRPFLTRETSVRYVRLGNRRQKINILHDLKDRRRSYVRLLFRNFASAFCRIQRQERKLFVKLVFYGKFTTSGQHLRFVYDDEKTVEIFTRVV